MFVSGLWAEISDTVIEQVFSSRRKNQQQLWDTIEDAAAIFRYLKTSIQN